MILKRLATHVAELAGWGEFAVGRDELDFAAGVFPETPVGSTEDLLQLHQAAVMRSIAALQAAADEVLIATLDPAQQRRYAFLITQNSGIAEQVLQPYLPTTAASLVYSCVCSAYPFRVCMVPVWMACNGLPARRMGR